jgi:hypothetical protein
VPTKKKAPHSFRNSAYPRRTNEGYYTEPWITQCIVPYIPLGIREVTDPAAGRGDILRVIEKTGRDIVAMDLETGQYDGSLGAIRKQDFFKYSGYLDSDRGAKGTHKAIITNPPYGGPRILYDGKKPPIAEAFLRHALKQNVRFVAMLLRTDFIHSVRRTDLFRDNPFYAFEVVLTRRPVWDWWIEKEPWDEKSHPQHNFSWFCWDKDNTGPPTQYWMGPKDVDSESDLTDTDWED